MSAIFFSQNFGQEGSHSCARCGRSYMHKVTLKRHQTYECGIEPMFSCPHCPYRGKHRRHLKNHVALKHYHISLDSRRFKCDLCCKSYSHKQSLYNHKKYECGKEPQFQCPHCPYKGKYLRHLRNHIGIKHCNLFKDL
ncbi:zinc finger Y-chromosomal protein-like isoform X1 [Rhodnius prolixus]|uniref:zinc finger Y-chromosomal protein-like isoform X1 n=1 Tax=Rhodnius prolixus TaxID=13249 RepID=UPI003D18F114